MIRAEIEQQKSVVCGWLDTVQPPMGSYAAPRSPTSGLVAPRAAQLKLSCDVFILRAWHKQRTLPAS